MADSGKDIFKKMNLETEEDREQFIFVPNDQDEEINVNGLGLSTCS